MTAAIEALRLLTAPERATLLRSLKPGSTMKSMAREADLSESAVKFHLKCIYRRLGCTDRPSAILALAKAFGLDLSTMVESILRDEPAPVVTKGLRYQQPERDLLLAVADLIASPWSSFSPQDRARIRTCIAHLRRATP